MRHNMWSSTNNMQLVQLIADIFFYFNLFLLLSYRTGNKLCKNKHNTTRDRERQHNTNSVTLHAISLKFRVVTEFNIALKLKMGNERF